MSNSMHENHDGTSESQEHKNIKHVYTNKQSLLARLKPKKTTTSKSEDSNRSRIFDRSTRPDQVARSRGLTGAFLSLIPGTTRLIDARVAKERNADIDQQLLAKRKHLRSLGYLRGGPHVNVLLMGCSESGKHTLLKDLKLNLEGPYSIEERKRFRDVVWSNMIQGMQTVLGRMEHFEVDIEDAALETCRTLILEAPYSLGGDTLPDGYREAVLQLRENEKVKKFMAVMEPGVLPTRCKFFLAEAENITAPGYLPSNKDILYSSGGPSGITAKTFREGPKWKYQFVELGGSRTERKKWIHYFERPEIIIFTVDISSYAHVLIEGQTATPLHENIALFESIAHSRWFVGRTHFILLFTHMDEFRENLIKMPLHEVYPEFNGTTWQDAAAHVKADFTRALYSQAPEPSWGPDRLRVHFWEDFPEFPVASFVTDLIQEDVTEWSILGREAPCFGPF